MREFLPTELLKQAEEQPKGLARQASKGAPLHIPGKSKSSKDPVNSPVSPMKFSVGSTAKTTSNFASKTPVAGSSSRAVDSPAKASSTNITPANNSKKSATAGASTFKKYSTQVEKQEVRHGSTTPNPHTNGGSGQGGAFGVIGGSPNNTSSVQSMSVSPIKSKENDLFDLIHMCKKADQRIGLSTFATTNHLLTVQEMMMINEEDELPKKGENFTEHDLTIEVSEVLNHKVAAHRQPAAAPSSSKRDFQAKNCEYSSVLMVRNPKDLEVDLC